MYSAIAIENFARSIAKQSDISLVRTFVETMKTMSGEDSDAEISEKGALDMKKRIARKLGIVEENLDQINFGLFMQKLIRYARPLHVNYPCSDGRTAILVLPKDIPEIAQKIARDLKEAARLASIMSRCALEKVTPDTPPVADPETGMSCRRVEPQKDNLGPGWNLAKKAVRFLFDTVKTVTVSVLVATSIMSAASYGMYSMIRPESPQHVISEIAHRFGNLESEKALSTKGVENIGAAFNDADFDSILQTDQTLSTFMEGVSQLENPVEKLDFVNRFWNTLEYMDDITLYGEGYAAKPSEMWNNQKGDCEDYALAKYAMLRKLGFAADDLHILCVNTREGNGHAILAAKASGEWHILDLGAKMMTTEEASQKYNLFFSANETGQTRYTEAEHQVAAKM